MYSQSTYKSILVYVTNYFIARNFGLLGRAWEIPLAIYLCITCMLRFNVALSSFISPSEQELFSSVRGRSNLRESFVNLTHRVVDTTRFARICILQSNERISCRISQCEFPSCLIRSSGPTSSIGESRHFVSRDLSVGFIYRVVPHERIDRVSQRNVVSPCTILSDIVTSRGTSRRRREPIGSAIFHF